MNASIVVLSEIVHNLFWDQMHIAQFYSNVYCSACIKRLALPESVYVTDSQDNACLCLNLNE